MASVAGAVPLLSVAVNQPVAPALYTTFDTASPVSALPPALLMAADCDDGVTPLGVLNVRLDGEAAIRGRAVTVTETCFDTPPEVAVTVAVPPAIPVTLPTPSTAATVEELDDHCTGRAVSDLPLSLFGVALIVARSPTVNAIDDGVMSIVDTGTGASLTVGSRHASATRRAYGAILSPARRHRCEVDMDLSPI
jgi:hypothetical protein